MSKRCLCLYMFTCFCRRIWKIGQLMYSRMHLRGLKKVLDTVPSDLSLYFLVMLHGEKWYLLRFWYIVNTSNSHTQLLNSFKILQWDVKLSKYLPANWIASMMSFWNNLLDKPHGCGGWVLTWNIHINQQSIGSRDSITVCENLSISEKHVSLLISIEELYVFMSLLWSQRIFFKT